MWATIGGAVLKTVLDNVLNENKPNNSNNTLPQTAYHPSGTYRPPPSSFNAGSSNNASSCQNCSGNANNANGTKKRDNTKKRQDNSKFCVVQMPQNGNFEINIKKTETQFASMSMQSSAQKKPQKFQKKPQNQQKGAQNSTSGMKPSNTNKVKSGSQNNQKPFNKINQKPNLPNQSWVYAQKPSNKINQKPNLSNQTTWMYVGRLKKGTTEADLRSYLTEKFPGHKFVIEQLPLYKDAKLPSFKIRVENTILESFQQRDHWPDGVTITKYIHNFVTK